MAVTLQSFPYRHISLFDGVDEKDVQRWLSRCEIATFPKEHILLQPDAANENMYILMAGQVSIHLSHASMPAIANLGVGECVGEMSIFDSQNPSAYVVAQSDVEALAISRQVLMSMVEESHEVAKNLLYLLSRRLRSGNQVVNSSQRLQKEYEQHANVDALTGLYNRRWIDNYFKRLVSNDNDVASLPSLSLMMIDVDHFKAFNDSHGHNAGDRALKCIADALQRYIRPTDTAIRYGGEEFIVLLPETSLEAAQLIAERVRTGVGNTDIAHADQRYPSVTISVGIASLQAGEGQDNIVAAADEALYLAKTRGRDRVCVNDRLHIAEVIESSP